MKMHQDEVEIDAELVERLVAEQFPELADLPISAFRSTGTVNAIYRIGDHLYARLPRMQQWAQDLDREWHWLPKLAPHLSLRVPEPVGKGHPTSSYPFSWALYGWIDGRPYADELVDDERQAAKDLAQFVVELRTMDPVVGAPRVGAPNVEAPRTGRKPLRRRGKERRCGSTPTSCGPTCSFTTVGSQRSSTSAGSGSAIRPLT